MEERCSNGESTSVDTLEAHTVAHRAAKQLAVFDRHALGDADRADAPRLRDHHVAVRAAPVVDAPVENELRDLRRLAAARLAAYQHHPVLLDRLQQLVPVVEHRQLLALIQMLQLQNQIEQDSCILYVQYNTILSTLVSPYKRAL